MKENQSYNSDVTYRGGKLLLLGKTAHLEENKTDGSSFQLDSQANHCGKHATQECVWSSINCTTIVDKQLQDNAGHVETNSHLVQPENCEVIESPSIAMASTRLARASNKNSRLVGKFLNLDYKIWNQATSASKMAIVGEPQPTTNTVKMKTNQTQDKCYAKKLSMKNRFQLHLISNLRMRFQLLRILSVLPRHKRCLYLTNWRWLRSHLHHHLAI